MRGRVPFIDLFHFREICQANDIFGLIIGWSVVWTVFDHRSVIRVAVCFPLVSEVCSLMDSADFAFLVLAKGGDFICVNCALLKINTLSFVAELFELTHRLLDISMNKSKTRVSKNLIS